MTDALGVGKLKRTLAKHRRATEFDRGGLGERLLDMTTRLQIRDFRRKVSPDGTPWPKLSPAYARWKARAYPGQPMGKREGLMAADENFRGQRRIVADEAVMVFGVTEEAQEEADHFSRDRPFIGLTDEMVHEADAIVRKHLDKST